MSTTYQASPIEHHCATNAETDARAEFLIDDARLHRPVTVRRLFFAATVAGVPRVEKTEAGYNKAQWQFLKLWRTGRMPYYCIAESTRYVHKPESWASPKEKVNLFGAEHGVKVQFHPLTLTHWQVDALNLPTRPPKDTIAADRRLPYPYAAELDAIPPDTLRHTVRAVIENHLPANQPEYLRHVERIEREQIMALIGAGA